MQDAHPRRLVFARQRVDDHLARGGAVGEVVEGPTGGLGAVVVDLGRAVVAGGRQRHAAEPGLFHQVGERHLLGADAHAVGQELDLAGGHAILLRREGGQPFLDRPRRRARRHAVDVRPRRGSRRRRVRHLAGIGGGDLDAIEVDLQLLGHHLRHLDEQALTHLGAAVIEMDAAVGINVEKGAGLVQMRRGEGDAELYRRQRQALLEIGTGGVERRDLPAALPVVRRRLQIGDQLRQDVVLDGHVIGRHVALALAVEIALADLQRILAELAGDRIHHLLDSHHALRPAEAAEGGVRHQVRLAATGGDARAVEVVAVVGMEHGAVGDGAGEVGGEAAIGGLHEFDAADAPGFVESDLVVDAERMPLARHDHVVVAVEPELGRPPGLHGGESGDDGPLRRLRFLASEAAAHAPHLDRHGVARPVKRVGDQVLHLARMLGRAMHEHVPILQGDGERDLALEIEMILSADIDATAEAAGR